MESRQKNQLRLPTHSLLKLKRSHRFPATTLADSISVDLPRDGVRAVRAARETGGQYLTVTDEQIIAAIGEQGKFGIFTEPAGATAYAGFAKGY